MRHGYGIFKDLSNKETRGLYIGQWSFGSMRNITAYRADGSITNENYRGKVQVEKHPVHNPKEAWFGNGLPFDETVVISDEDISVSTDSGSYFSSSSSDDN